MSWNNATSAHSHYVPLGLMLLHFCEPVEFAAFHLRLGLCSCSMRTRQSKLRSGCKLGRFGRIPDLYLPAR